jgi:outer membrane protein OmpA-like peptidoglycan-associated protein
MHRFPLYVPLLLLFASTATAQVTVDMHALDQLQGGNQGQPPAASKEQKGAAHQPARKEAPAKAAPKTASGTPAATPRGTAAKTETGRQSSATPAKASGSQPGSPPATAAVRPSAPVPQTAPEPAPAPPPAAALPSEPPPNVSLSPLEPGTPPAKPTTPPTGVVAADAGGAATPIDDGLRITFGSGRPELSPASESALKAFVGKAPQGDNTSINVLAFAAGTADDPSTARRLSLSRALAVRAVLMSEGIPSARIYLRALGTGSQVASQGSASQAPGAQGLASQGPADRVDVTLLGGNAPRTTAGAAP